MVYSLRPLLLLTFLKYLILVNQWCEGLCSRFTTRLGSIIVWSVCFDVYEVVVIKQIIDILLVFFHGVSFNDTILSQVLLTLLLIRSDGGLIFKHESRNTTSSGPHLVFITGIAGASLSSQGFEHFNLRWFKFSFYTTLL